MDPLDELVDTLVEIYESSIHGVCCTSFIYGNTQKSDYPVIGERMKERGYSFSCADISIQYALLGKESYTVKISTVDGYVYKHRSSKKVPVAKGEKRYVSNVKDVKRCVESISYRGYLPKMYLALLEWIVEESCNPNGSVILSSVLLPGYWSDYILDRVEAKDACGASEVLIDLIKVYGRSWESSEYRAIGRERTNGSKFIGELTVTSREKGEVKLEYVIIPKELMDMEPYKPLVGLSVGKDLLEIEDSGVVTQSFVTDVARFANVLATISPATPTKGSFDSITDMGMYGNGSFTYYGSVAVQIIRVMFGRYFKEMCHTPLNSYMVTTYLSGEVWCNTESCSTYIPTIYNPGLFIEVRVGPSGGVYNYEVVVCERY